MAVLCLPVAPAVASHAVTDAPVDSGLLPPDNQTAPSVSGTERDGQTLTGNAGQWSGGTIETFWLRCNSGGASCIHVDDADLSYALAPADVDKVIKLRVRATNTVTGGYNEEEDQTGVIAPAPPVNTDPPSFAGQPREGQLLDGNRGTWTGTPTISYAFQWWRCPTASCSPIAGATSENYFLTAADVGTKVSLQVLASGPGGQANTFSPLSAVVAPTQTFPPPPPGGQGDGSTPTPGGTLAGLRPLRPFPTVSIGGRLFRSGVVLTEVRVRRAPKGARITVTCRGRGCPFKRVRYRMRRSSFRIRRLQRRLGRGTVITIYIRKGNAIGKYTRIRIRRGQAPARLDRCLRPGSSRPRRCP